MTENVAGAVQAGDVEAGDEPFCRAMLDSATQVWLAGIGALWLGTVGRVQDEGTRLLDVLIKEGERFQKRAKGVTVETVAEVRDRTADTWAELEKVFEDRVSQALGRLSVPTRDDVDALREKIQELTAAVEKLSHSASQNVGAESAKTRRPRANS